ncbi:MAG: isocitrate/isopropylmalate dehydrogenase family protein [Candidatus Xenobium sp.]|jgi:3-isopropylmalate dehydrogenase|nr:3-isopropylmalate dehydrogenase [Burkholderiales bacterium]
MYRLGLIPGDGIGPEVLEQGLRVLEESSRRYGFSYRVHHYPFGADHYLETGELVPDSDLEEIRNLDALLVGALGDPRLERGFLEREILGRLHRELDLFINLRPVKLYSEDLCPLREANGHGVDLVILRENIGDAYAGLGGFLRQGTPDEVAISEAVFTRRGVERVLRYAFEVARSRPRHHLTLVDKSSLVPAHELWQRTFAEVAREYPDVKTATIEVDVAVAWLVRTPEWFDVIVTTTMLGDILMALGSQIQGGVGLAASASLNPGQVSLFEPIHGAAPKLAGTGAANPIGAILAVQMMLQELGEVAAASSLDTAVRTTLNNPDLKTPSPSEKGLTRKYGELVLKAIR